MKPMRERDIHSYFLLIKITFMKHCEWKAKPENILHWHASVPVFFIRIVTVFAHKKMKDWVPDRSLSTCSSPQIVF